MATVPYPSAAVYPHQIHHHNPLSFGFPSAYAPGPPSPAFSYAAATHSFPSPYISTPAPFPSTFPAPPTPAPPPTGAPPLSATYQSEQSNVACYPCGCSSPTPRLLDPVLTAPNRECRPSQSHTSTPTTTPYTATFPYPPPASAHTPASGFSQNWPNWPPPAPDPTTSTPSGCWSSSTTTAVPPHHPATAGQDASSPAPCHSTRTNAQPWVASAPSPELAFRPQLTGETSTFIPHPASPATSTSSPACGYSTEAAAILHRVQHELLNIQARLCQQQAREQTSFNTLQGELAKLKSRVSQCAVSDGKQSTRATPGSSPLRVIRTTPVASKVFDKMPISSSGCSKVFGKQSSAAASSPTTSGSSRFGASGSTYAAPQVFGETPTSSLWQGTHGSVPDCCSGRHNPSLSACVSNFSEQNFDERPSPNSWQETHGTAPDYRSGHQNLIQSSCPSNLSEKNLGGMPQSYGFSNLNRQSIILADGTERTYFTLPADYPLKQATPQMSPSAVANIAVTAQLPVEAKEACLTAFCCSKTNSIADSETMFVHDMQPPKAVQDDHKEQNDEKAVGNVQQLRDSHWNVLVIPVRRREWDPGALLPLMSNKIQHSESLLVPNLQLPMNVQDDHKVIKEMHVSEEKKQDNEHFLECFSKALGTGQNSACLNIIPDVQDFTPELQQQDEERACNCPVQKASDSSVTNPNQLSIDHSMRELRLLWDPGDYTSLSSRLNRDILEVLSCLSQQIYCKVPPRQDNLVLQFEGDPGILSLIDMMLGKTIVPNRIHSRQTPCTLVILLGQPVSLNQVWAQSVPCFPWCHISNAFLEVPYCCLPFVLDYSYSEPIQQLVCYSRMFSSTAALMSAMCMSTATSVRMGLVLWFGNIAQEEKDAAAVYQVLQIQSMRKTSLIWDPGIESILVFYKWMHIQIIQLLHCSAQLNPTQITTYCPSNIGFVHQQGVKKYCYEKNLLSSPNYLQLLELDIIYITFLPP